MYIQPTPKAYLKLFLFVCTLFFFGFFTFGNNLKKNTPPNNNQIVQDLNINWLVFDKYYNDYVPYLTKFHQDYHSFSQIIDFENNKGLHLSIAVNKTCYLFVNNVYFMELGRNQWENIALNTLQNLNPKTNKTLITIYFPQKGLGQTQLYFTNLSYSTLKNDLVTVSETQKSNFNNLKITKTYYKDFVIILIVIVLILFLMLRHNQSMITDKYLNYNDLFTTSRRVENYVINKPFEFGNIFFLLVLCTATSLLLLEINKNYYNFLPDFFNLNLNYTFQKHFQAFLLLILISIVGYFTKYILITLISGLYRFKKIDNIHYFKLIQYNAILIIPFAIIVAILSHHFVYKEINIQSILKIFIILFFAIRLFLIFSNIINLGKVKILHLFSYLCIVEIAPILIGLQFLF